MGNSYPWAESFSFRSAKVLEMGVVVIVHDVNVLNVIELAP